MIALVGSGDEPLFSPRKLRLCNTRNNTLICELNFITAIQAVKLNKKRMIVVMETKIHIYDITNVRIMHTIDTITNSLGLVAFSPSDNCNLVYPANRKTGDVCLFDALSLHSIKLIQAHKMPVTAMAINCNGTLIATASETGTIIRVFSVSDASKPVCTFRRGSSPATIYSMAFSLDSSLLVASSSNGTVHVFKLPKVENYYQPGIVSTYLPEYLSDIWEPARCFAWFKLPVVGLKSLCGFTQYNSEVMVVTADGYFCTYSLDATNGGECKLLQENSLLKNNAI